ncbi:hypothetical protein [Nocardia sp. NPDC050406]|uniref:hypothetical protein n=1 Tax=Nocardia sp. NPDC050406 TaxID=3364318 RepID=UPI00379803D3
MTGAGSLAEIARKARRAQDAIERVRGTAAVPGVRIEVAADGRITGLELADSGLAQAISSAHARALREVREQVARLRQEVRDDPGVVEAMRKFMETEGVEQDSAQRGQPADPSRGVARPVNAVRNAVPPMPVSRTAPPHADLARNASSHPAAHRAARDEDEFENPHALPPEVRRRYGL